MMFHVDISGSEDTLQFDRRNILNSLIISCRTFDFQEMEHFIFEGDNVDLAKTTAIVSANNGETLFSENFAGTLFRDISFCPAHRLTVGESGKREGDLFPV